MKDQELYRNRTPAKNRRADEDRAWDASLKALGAAAGFVAEAARDEDLSAERRSAGVRHILDD